MSLRFILDDKVDNFKKWEEKSLLLPRLLLQTHSNCWGKNREGTEVPALRETAILHHGKGEHSNIKHMEYMKTQRPLLMMFFISGIIFSFAAFPAKYFSGFWLDGYYKSALCWMG